MVSLLGKILRKFKKKDRIRTYISPQTLKEDKIIREQQEFIQSLEAEISKIKAKSREKKIDNEDIKEEIDLIEELEKKQNKIRKEDEKVVFDFKKLFINSKSLIGKKELEICDKDDSVVFDKFKTIGVLDNNQMVVIGKSGNIINSGRTLSEVFHKPNTLKNQERRGKLLLSVDKNMIYTPDLEETEIPEMSYDERDDSYHESEERTRKVKEKFIELDTENRRLREDKKHLEQTIADLRDKMKEEKLALEIRKNRGERKDNELISALNSDKESLKLLTRLDKHIVVLNEQKKISEKKSDVHEEANEELFEELEEEKKATNRRKVKDEIQSDVEWAKKVIPKEVPIKDEKEEKKFDREYTDPKKKIGEVK